VEPRKEINNVMNSLHPVKKSLTKGLLKPFKGKGDLLFMIDDIEDELRFLEQDAVNLCNDSINAGKAVGLSLRKMKQSGKAVGLSLHWRDSSTHGIGIEKFQLAVSVCRFDSIKNELWKLEEARLLFNLRSKMIHYSLRNLRKTLSEIEVIQDI